MEDTKAQNDSEERSVPANTEENVSSDPPRVCPYQSSSKESKEPQREELKLHTEGVSEYLTHYERTGYTEDSLRQFVVLDELNSEGKKRKREPEDGEDELDEEDDGSDEDEQDENNDSSDSYYDETDHSDSDVPDDEVEKMLEEGLSDMYKVKRQRLANGRYAKKLDPGQYENRRKLVLDEIATNHFEMLPEGWVQVTHNTGIPIYLHKTTRVCTVSMPYFLGPGSARKHKVPISAIPCLQYRKALEKEKKDIEGSEVATGESNVNCQKGVEGSAASENITEVDENDPPKGEEKLGQTKQADEPSTATQDSQVTSLVPRHLPAARIETARENADAVNMNHLELREYCQRLFRFKTIEVMRFKTWAERRKFAKVKKKERQLQRPSLPDGTKLITFPILEGGESASGGRAKKEWIMNPNGKSYVCILHEYVQHALKKQPVYEFKDLENPATPYSATVSINKMKYGTGVGTSKKQAKAEAAKMTLEILIPEMRQKIENDNNKSRGPGRVQHTDLSFFDDIKIEDPRVHEFCAKTTEPSPYAILLTCLKRNFGLSDIDIKYQVNTLRHQKNEFKMSVGNHSATVICKNKREGKQRASQSILQAMHPHINNWGSLLRLYGSRSIKTPREKKIEEQEITTLQNRASANQPNWAILGKLKEAMSKLEESRAAVKPIGEFVPPDNVELPTTSSSNLNNIQL